MMGGKKKKKASSKQIQFLCQFASVGPWKQLVSEALAVIPEVEVGAKALGVTGSIG